MNKKILSIQKRVDALRTKKKEIYREVVLACPHEHIAECHNMDGPEWRICLDCGLTEEGWGCGYGVLAAPRERVGTIDRHKLLELRTVSLWQRDYGLTIEARIDKWLG